MLRGPGSVLPSSLQIIQPGLAYSIQVALANDTIKGRVVLATTRMTCTDIAGNMFQRSINSSTIVRFDRNPVFVNVWTPIADAQLFVSNQTRTVEATNRPDDLMINLDFTEPTVNSTQQLLTSLRVSDGILIPTRRKSHGNRRFAFLIANVSAQPAVITVSLNSATVVSRAGTRVQPVNPVSFIFDQVRPRPRVSIIIRDKTRDRLVPVLIQFPEPVFQFGSPGINVSGGNISSFKQVSSSTYFAELAIAAGARAVVSVPENKTADAAGNRNLASNIVQIKHYEVPPISVALSSFATAGILATALTSGALCLSSASLSAAGALPSRSVSSPGSDPSLNLLGMAAHLQLFALSDWLTVGLPIEYRETVRGLSWIIPHVKVPWDRPKSTTISNNFVLDSTSPMLLESGKRVKGQRQFSSSYGARRKLGSNSSVFGPPFDADEYQRFFEKPASPRKSLKDFLKKYDGWKDFERNMFWLAVVGGALVLLHVVATYIFRWRMGTPVRGALTVPRFELFLTMLFVPCTAQASSFIIRGGTTLGIVLGVLLLAIPAAFLVCIVIFLFVGVIVGALVQYKEVVLMNNGAPQRRSVLPKILGGRTVGKWVRKEGLSLSFIAGYGIIFEDRRGPPKMLLLDNQDVQKWVDSGSNGIGRMKAVNSDDENEKLAVSKFRKSLGAAQTLYVAADMSRRIAVGVLAGSYSGWSQGSSQVIMLLAFTGAQLLYLVLSKPFIRRGVQAAETLSLMCEAGLFAAALVLVHRPEPGHDNTSISILLLLLLIISFAAQLINEWYALVRLVLRLSPAEEPSFKVGLLMFGRGLALPFMPRRSWPRFTAASSQQQQQQQQQLTHHHVVSTSPDAMDFQPPPGSASPITVTETGVPYKPSSRAVAAAAPDVVPAGSKKNRDAPSGSSDRTPAPDAVPGSKKNIDAPSASSSRGGKQRWSMWPRSESSSRSKAGDDGSNAELVVLQQLAKASFAAAAAAAASAGSGGDDASRGKQKMMDDNNSNSSTNSTTNSSNSLTLAAGLASPTSNKLFTEEALAGANRKTPMDER